MEDNEYEFDDNEIQKVQVGLSSYLLSLKGYSSRAINELNPKFPSHVTISKQIRWGQDYFKMLFPIMEAIKEVLIELKMKRGEITLNLTPEELKKSLELFQNTPEAQKEFPDLYKMLQKEGKKILES